MFLVSQVTASFADDPIQAHCISEWGHSFRPDYLKIARFAQEANVERVACLTATATPKVAQDICDAFSIPKEGLFTTTVYRPNLRLLVQSNPKNSDDVANLVKFLRQNPGPTIVYVTIQKGAELLAEALGKHGFLAKAFHAGMKTEIKASLPIESVFENILHITLHMMYTKILSLAWLRRQQIRTPPLFKDVH